MGIIEQNCKVLRHEAAIEILQPGTSEFTYFTDLTENHYKAMISFRLELATGASPDAQLIVTPRTGPDTIINFSGATTIQIEDALSVTLKSTSSTHISGGMDITKDFCMCCPYFGEIQRHEGDFSFRGSDFLFTDLTENHYKAMAVVKGRSEGQIVVTPRMGDATTIAIPPLGQSVIQIEDAQAVSFSTRGAPEGPPNIVQIIKDFCISCS